MKFSDPDRNDMFANMYIYGVGSEVAKKCFLLLGIVRNVQVCTVLCIF